jgi:hypothetical protein
MVMCGLNSQTSRLMSLNTLRNVLENFVCFLVIEGLGQGHPSQSAAPLRREWHFGHLSLCQAREQHRFVEWIVLHLQVERDAGEPFEMGRLQIASLCHCTQKCTYIERT